MTPGRMRDSMQALVAELDIDPEIIENKCRVVYRLSHPTAQIVGKGEHFEIVIEPAGWSQIAGAGPLDAQYFFWIFIRCKPSMFGINDGERLSKLMEYLTQFIHGKNWGGLNTFLSRAMINYRSIVLKTKSRDIHFDLAKDEIGACLMFWQSEKSAAELIDDEAESEE